MAAQASEQGSASATLTGKRRRIALACDACRLRKSRCDGRRPSCMSCVSLGFDCQYAPGDTATNVIVRKEYMSDVDQRLTMVETVVQRLNYMLEGHLSACTDGTPFHPSKDSRPVVSSAVASHVREGLTRATGLEEPQDEDASPNGMAMTFLEERTSAFFGESSNINFTRLLLRTINAVHQSAWSTPAAVGREFVEERNMQKASRAYTNPNPAPLNSLDYPMTALPSTEEMDSLLDIYFDTAGVVFPFIHEETMRQTYTEFKANGFTRVRRTWLGNLNVIFAMATNFDLDKVPSARRRLEKSNVFYQRATALCGELSKQVISLEIVHYLLLVVIHCQGSQRSVQAWNIHGLLIRSAIALGLHCAPAKEDTEPLQAEYRRRTWIVIYCLDKVLSAAFGRPASIPDAQMQDRQPMIELPPQSSDVINTDCDIAGEFLAVSFPLYQVMSRSLAKQYTANVQHTDSELDDTASLQTSCELRKALRLWSARLPPTLRLCEVDVGLLLKNTKVNRLRVILTLRYHNLSILIHRPLLSATIRHLFSENTAPPASPPYFIQLAIGEAHECIRAAESTIDVVYTVINSDQTSKNNLGMWYFTLYYVFTASLVMVSRLLWAQHGQDVVDEAAVASSNLFLKKAETIFQKLDRDNALVFSCARYIRSLSEMCNSPGPATDAQEIRSDQDPVAPAACSDNQSTSATGVTDPFETTHVGAAGDVDPFQLFTSEIFDPSIFEGFNIPTDMISRSHVWEPPL